MTPPCPEDLLGLRRVGQLDAVQERQLDEHLRCCADCALDEGLHESFEKAGRPRAFDEMILARVVDRTMLKRPRPRSRRTWSLAAGIAAGLLLAAGLASAAVWLYDQTKSPASPAAGMALAPPALSQPAPPLADPDTTPAPEVAPSEPTSAEPPQPQPARLRAHRRPRVLDEASAAPALDLKAIFAAANEARRAGQLEHAGALYAELQRRFPESREARLSLVSYGRILLDRGRAAEALAQFQRHLQAEGGGVLAAEALYGQARALTRLHREAEARRCWADLLARFPDSIFADVARSQLGARP